MCINWCGEGQWLQGLSLAGHAQMSSGVILFLFVEQHDQTEKAIQRWKLTTDRIESPSLPRLVPPEAAHSTSCSLFSSNGLKRMPLVVVILLIIWVIPSGTALARASVDRLPPLLKQVQHIDDIRPAWDQRVSNLLLSFLTLQIEQQTLLCSRTCWSCIKMIATAANFIILCGMLFNPYQSRTEALDWALAVLYTHHKFLLVVFVDWSDRSGMHLNAGNWYAATFLCIRGIFSLGFTRRFSFVWRLLDWTWASRIISSIFRRRVTAKIWAVLRMFQQFCVMLSPITRMNRSYGLSYICA